MKNKMVKSLAVTMAAAMAVTCLPATALAANGISGSATAYAGTATTYKVTGIGKNQRAVITATNAKKVAPKTLTKNGATTKVTPNTAGKKTVITATIQKKVTKKVKKKKVTTWKKVRAYKKTVTVYNKVTSVAVTPKAAQTMYKGATKTFKATIKPAKNIKGKTTWTSSNKTVGTITAAGKFTAKAAGTTQVQAKRDGKASNKVKVTVYNKVSSVKISGTDHVNVGETAQLTATLAPTSGLKPADKKVTWKSSDESIATVDANGKVTGVKAGEVDITATAGGQSATVKGFAVNDKVVALTKVELDKTSPKAGEPLTATVTPADATGVTFEWKFNGEVQSATGAEFTVPNTAKKGDVIIVTAKDALGNTQAAAATVGGEQDESGVVVTGDTFLESTAVEGTIGIVNPYGELIGAYNGIMTDLTYRWYCAETVDGQYLDAAAYATVYSDAAAAKSTLTTADLAELAYKDRPYVYCVATGKRNNEAVSYTSGKVFIGDSTTTDPAYVSTNTNFTKALDKGAKNIVLMRDLTDEQDEELNYVDGRAIVETEIPEGVTVDLNGHDLEMPANGKNKGTITNSYTAKAVAVLVGGKVVMYQTGQVENLAENLGTIEVPSKASIRLVTALTNKGTIATEAASDEDDVYNSRGHILNGVFTADNGGDWATANAGGGAITTAGVIQNEGEIDLGATGTLVVSGNGTVQNVGNITVTADNSAAIKADGFTNDGSIELATDANADANAEAVYGTKGGTIVNGIVDDGQGEAEAWTPDAFTVKDGLDVTIDTAGNAITFASGAAPMITVPGAANLSIVNSKKANADKSTVKAVAANTAGVLLQTTSSKTGTFTLGNNVKMDVEPTTNAHAIVAKGSGSAAITLEKGAEINKDAAAYYVLNQAATKSNVTVTDNQGYGDGWKTVAGSTDQYWAASSAQFVSTIPTSGTYQKAPVITADDLKVTTAAGATVSFKDAITQGAIKTAGNVSFRFTKSDGTTETPVTAAVDGNGDFAPAALITKMTSLPAGEWTVNIVDTTDSFAPFSFVYAQGAKQVDDKTFELTMSNSANKMDAVNALGGQTLTFTDGGLAEFEPGTPAVTEGDDQHGYYAPDVESVTLRVKYEGSSEWVEIPVVDNTETVVGQWKIGTMSELTGNGQFEIVVTMKNNFKGKVTITGKAADLYAAQPLVAGTAEKPATAFEKVYE